jgi:hypothetical protein
VLACVLVLLLHQGHGIQAPTPASSVDQNARACVLADANDPALGAVDAGLQQAARAGRLNVQHYLVAGTAADARPLLNGMIAARCDVVIGVGGSADGAIEAYAADGQPPAARLIVVGATGPATDVAVLPSAGLTPQAVAERVKEELG